MEVKREPQEYVIPKLREDDGENMRLKKSLIIKTELPDCAIPTENHGTLHSEVKVEGAVVESVRFESRKLSGYDENRKRKRECSVGESDGRSKEHNKRKKEDLSPDGLRFFVGGKTGGRLLNGSRKILWAIEKESGTRIKIGGEIGDEVIVRGSKEAQAEVKAVLQMVNVDFWLNDQDIKCLLKHNGEKGKLIHQIERHSGTLIDVGGERGERRRPVTIVGTRKGRREAIQCIQGSTSSR